MNTTRRFLLCACGAAALTASLPVQLRARAALPPISMAEASPFYSGLLVGGVLAAETDRMFLERKR